MPKLNEVSLVLFPKASAVNADVFPAVVFSQRRERITRYTSAFTGY